MSEYDLKKSEKGIGQLYPILEAKDGEVIDGFHREGANKNWKRVRLEHIDTEEKKLVARLVSNFHRRQITTEEKKEWINGLAKIYKKQGLKVISKDRRNEIMARLMEVTGLSDRAIGLYLNEDYKRQYTIGRRPPIVPASERIEHDLGKEYVQRHREEVLAEEKPKIEQQVKAKLLKSPTFQREVIREIQKPQLSKEVCPVLPPIEAEETEPIPSVTQPSTKVICPKCGHKFSIEEARVI